MKTASAKTTERWPGGHIRDRLWAALVGDVHHLDAGHALEQFDEQVRGGSGSARRIGELTRLLFRERDELGHRAHRQRRMDREDRRDLADQRHRREMRRRPTILRPRVNYFTQQLERPDWSPSFVGQSLRVCL
jgi:hypothetical protein